MTVIGLIVSILSFIFFFLFLDLTINNTILCFVFSAVSVIGMLLAASGYDKSYKSSKKSVRTLKDKFRMITAVFINLLVLLVCYHALFRREDLRPLIYSLPYIFAVMAVVWFAGFITILIRIIIAKKKERKRNICPVCGSLLSDSENYCSKCGQQFNKPKTYSSEK